MGKASKDKRDLYYRKAKEQGWRARSAFKLLQLDSEFHLLGNNVKRIVDLCAAPGSWSQVLSRLVKDNKDSNCDAKIVAVDLQPISPIDGVYTLQADITHPSTLSRILEIFGNKSADLVVSDGAPDVTGLHDLDEYIQAELIRSALSTAMALLRPGGTFVAKIFRGRDADLLYSQLGCFFSHVSCAKPRASRLSSLESFVVCQDYRPCNSLLTKNPTILTNDNTNNNKILSSEDDNMENNRNPNLPSLYSQDSRLIAPFVACGDLSEYDSDATYTRSATELSLDPVQPPTAPPYKTALGLRKGK